jgi:oxaloacetate decarboxylase alpha subunit
MDEIRFVDTTLRDGQQSLWAEGMRTGMMLPVAEQLDRAGFKSIDFIGTSYFKKCVRELREDPWERIRLISKKITKTPLSIMVLHSATSFDLTPLSVFGLFMERAAAAGIKQMQILDPSNDMSFRIPEAVKSAKEAGLKVSMALIYSHSPKHTDEYYAKKTRDAVKLGVDIIYLKDPGGLLTPERIPTIVGEIFKNASGIPLELHSHCTTGLAPICYLEAAKAGIRTFHTAIPPLANASSQPSIFNMINNLRLLNYAPSVNPDGIVPISKHFNYIAKREGFPIGAPLEYDYYQYVHQVPGGVISNLKHQLGLMHMQDRLNQVLEESIRVKENLGYPIMVTPFSQFVASQAVMNMLTGERYKQVTDEIIKYVLGFWGKEASSAVDPNITDRIMSMPRAKELLQWQPSQQSIKEIRQSLGGVSVSDDELVLRYIVQNENEIKAMQAAAGPVKEYVTSQNPLVMVINELLQKTDLGYVHVKKDDFSLTLRKNEQTVRQ